MRTQVQYRLSTGVIEAIGYWEVPPADGGLAVIEITDPAEIAKLDQQGLKTIDEDGVITVTPPDPDAGAIPTPPPSPQQQHVDQIVAAGKAALEAAPIETDEGRALAAIFAGALDGLGATFGTPQGEQP